MVYYSTDLVICLTDGACPVDVNFDVCNYTSFGEYDLLSTGETSTGA